MSAGLRMSMTRLSLLNLLYDSRAASDYSRCANVPDGNIEKAGEVREWLNRAVSKTVEPLRVPWVRIPPSPPKYNQQLTKSFQIQRAIACNGDRMSKASMALKLYARHRKGCEGGHAEDGRSSEF